MNIIILNESNKPIYEQIYEQIVIAIANGEITENSCLPSIRAMARELNVSVITTQKTYEKLESNGFTYTIPGKGCFVSPRDNEIGETKNSLAAEKIKEQISYFKSLNLTLEDAKKILEDNWNK